MDQREWTKINKIVDTALDLKKEKRSTFIEEKCGDNEELRYKVTELLRSIEQSDTEDFLEETKAFPSHLVADFSNELESHDSSLIGQTIGQYKIIKLIGHGGMGSVFLAERADDAYDRQVAFKILRQGMDTPSNVARFKRERTILASLNHPNIARLLDGGVTKSGLPYLVMEYVDGTPLLEYCDKHDLSVEKRLELFKSVCKAVQHAHRNATIHRDLKPSNIYVNNDGAIKVLDFGIAKLLEPENPEKTLFETQTGARMLTLGYAAPEQIESKAITTATDSYTLGLLLYELLAGVHPFDMDDKDLTSIEKLICIQIPVKPSKKFVKLPETEKTEIASRRHTTPSDLPGNLKGDLDAIVMKALRKEPDARYPSVEQMLEDLNRYEQSRPLIAQSDTLQYRVGKFMRRNRRMVIGTLLIIVTIIGFGTYHVNQITQERNIAENEAQKAKTVKNFLIDIFQSADPQSPEFEGKDLTAEQLLINGKNSISDQLKGQPEIYTEVSLAVGDALRNIEALDEAEQSYNKVLDISSSTDEPLVTKVRAYTNLAHITIDKGKYNEAHEIANKAQKIFEDIENPSPALETTLLGALAGTSINVQNYKKAENYYRKADSIYSNTELKNDFSYIYLLADYAQPLFFRGKYQKAERVMRRSNELHRKRYSEPTLTVAENYHGLGMVNRELGNFEQSNDYFLKAVELKSKLAGSESITTAHSIYSLAQNYEITSKFEESEKYARKALTIYQEHPKLNYYRMQAKNYIGVAKMNQNEFPESITILQEVLNKKLERLGEEDKSTAVSYYNLAEAYRKDSQFSNAAPLFIKAAKIDSTTFGNDSRDVGIDLNKLAAVYTEMEEYESAQKYFLKAQPIFEDKFPAGHHRKAEFYLQFGKLKLETDNPEQAHKLFEEAHNIFLNNFGSEDKRASKAKSLLQQAEKFLSS